MSDQDLVDPPDTMLADHTFAFTTDQAPSVSATVPTGGAAGVTTAANLTVTFSEPVDVAGNWFQIVCPTSGTRNVADTVVSGGPTTYTADPNADFAAGETCTTTVFAAQVSDQDANDPPDTMAANFVFAFTTDAAPAVLSTVPADGAGSVALDAGLTLTFTEPVLVTGNWFQIACATSGTRLPPDTTVTGGPTVYTIDPTVDFVAGEACIVTVSAALVSDLDTNDPPDTMAADHVFAFTTDQAPAVLSTNPAEGGSVTIDANLGVTFTEPVDVAGNWFQIVCTLSGVRNVADTVVVGGPTTYTIDPTADLTGGESCTMTFFASAVTDQDTGDPPDTMAADHVLSFATDQAPTVAASVPASGAGGVTASANLTLTFSEPVTVTGNWFQIVCPTSGTRNVADTVVTRRPDDLHRRPERRLRGGRDVHDDGFRGVGGRRRRQRPARHHVGGPHLLVHHRRGPGGRDHGPGQREHRAWSPTRTSPSPSPNPSPWPGTGSRSCAPRPGRGTSPIRS